LKTEKTDMNAEQIKDEIRNLSRIDKIEIYRWIDEEAAVDLLSRIGLFRSLAIRQQIEQTCNAPPRRGGLSSLINTDW
jgi:hypothetical protein